MNRATLRLSSVVGPSSQRRDAMKKIRYVKPKVVGTSSVHPC